MTEADKVFLAVESSPVILQLLPPSTAGTSIRARCTVNWVEEWSQNENPRLGTLVPGAGSHQDQGHIKAV